MRPLFTILLFIACVGPSNAQTLGTCKIYPSNNPWNERIDTLPVHWNSARYIAHVGASIHVHPDFGSNALYGIPWVAVGASQPFVPIDVSQGYTSECDPGPMPVPLNAPIEGGGNDGGDDHVLAVDTSNHHLYELYQGVRGATGWKATASAVFGLDSNNYRPDSWTSCDAAGLPIWPGLVKKYECDAGEIKHALRFTVQRAYTQKGWIFPARHHAGGTTDTTTMPFGLRMRLKASFDDSKFTGNAKVISTALKRYGIILADNGSNWYISGETNTSWDDNDVGQLRGITGGDFEAVYTGPVRTTANQYPDPVLPIPTNTAGLTSPAFAYDTTLAGTSNTFQVLLRNMGSSTVHINLVKIKSGVAYSMTSTPPTSIAPNATSSITIQFSPTKPGQIVDTLTIKSDDATNPNLKVPLVGLGTAGVFHVLASPYRFGRVPVGQPDTMAFSLSNTGNGVLNVDVSNLSGSNPDFSIISVQPPGLPPFLVQPKDSIQAVVRFNPSKLGYDTTSFTLSISDFAGESHDTVVSIVGEGALGESVANPLEPLGLRIYPNPTQGILNVAGNTGPITVEVTDALGRGVYSGKLATSGGALDLSSLPNGSYFVHLSTPNGSASQHIQLLR